jgi:hypothetical protein
MTTSTSPVIRHETFGSGRMTVDEAAMDMHLSGYRFHLFTEAGTGIDSVLYLVDDDPRYRLAQLDPYPDGVTRGRNWVSVSPQRAPRIGIDEAVDRLVAGGWPFVFYEDATTHRGCVVYHRDDGKYGLVRCVA